MGTLTARLALAFFTAGLVFLLTGCVLAGQHRDEVTDMQTLKSRVDEVGYSRLDDAGVQEIVDSQIAKFDLRSGTETLPAVGLQGSKTGPAIGGANKPDILLVLDGPQGREITDTRTILISVSPRTNTLDEIVYWRSAKDLDGAIAEVRDGITRWGYSRERVDRWVDRTEVHRNDSEKSVVSSGVSPTGLVTSVEVSYKEGKPVVMRYIVHVMPKMYDPRNLDAVRLTGLIDVDIITGP